jgi:hypothetical protein
VKAEGNVSAVSAQEPRTACGRLLRLPRFAQSGSWEIARGPPESTLGLDRESEQPAMSGPSRCR